MSADSHQAAPNIAKPATLPGGDPGRAPDDLPPHVRSKIVRYYVRHDKAPTRRMVSEWADIPGGLDNDKWHRWQMEAIGR